MCQLKTVICTREEHTSGQLLYRDQLRQGVVSLTLLIARDPWAPWWGASGPLVVKNEQREKRERRVLINMKPKS